MFLAEIIKKKIYFKFSITFSQLMQISNEMSLNYYYLLLTSWL